MEKYLIVLDLDETLLHSDKTISDYSKAILKKCQKLGCKIVVSTARSYIRTVDFAKQIDADFICSFNGNFVCDRDDNVLGYNPIASDTSKKLIEELHKYTRRIVNEGLYGSFCTSKEDVDFVDSKFASVKFVENLQSCKLLVHCTREEYHILKLIAKKYDVSVTFSREKDTARILPASTDKWYGVQKILTFLDDGNNYKIIAFGDDIADLETLKNADIGVRMANSTTELIENIAFSTSNNDDDGVARFLCNYFNLEQAKVNYNNVKLLDCSLRDGGHLNSSNFGYSTIINFVDKLAKAKVDIIEVGFLQDATFNKNVAIYPSVSEAETILSGIDCKSSIISLLTQVDKYDISKLEPCSGKVKLIRVSFHSNYIDLGMEYCRQVKNKGYMCSINPINFSHYTNEEVVALISKVNQVNPDFFSIVDTFGVLLNNDFKNKLSLINHLLNKTIKCGIHLHDNLNLAFSSAQTLIEQNSSNGEIVIDTSVSGMGRAPGNLKTEMMAYYLNEMSGSDKYSMKYIYSLIENEISCLKRSLDWENNFAYGITAFEKAHRTYAEYLLNEGMNMTNVQKIVQSIPKEHRGRFNEDVIRSICILENSKRRN